MRRWLVILVAVLLVSTVESRASAATWHDASRAQFAQAEQSFEETNAPDVALEGPENLERTDEEPSSLPNIPPTPPQEDAPVPEWWKNAQESLNEAIDERAGPSASPTGESEETSSGSSGSRGFARNAMQGIIALCVVLALILLCTYFIKRFGAKTPLLAGASLGTVLGKIYLTPKIALHFVRVKNVVLVVGVTPNGVSTIAQLNGALFEDQTQTVEGAQKSRQLDFLSQLTSASDPQSTRAPEGEDDEIASLKGDLARLQKYLQETSRELGD